MKIVTKISNRRTRFTKYNSIRKTTAVRGGKDSIIIGFVTIRNTRKNILFDSIIPRSIRSADISSKSRNGTADHKHHSGED